MGRRLFVFAMSCSADWRSCEGNEIVAWRRVAGSCGDVEESSVFVRRNARAKGAGGGVISVEGANRKIRSVEMWAGR